MELLAPATDQAGIGRILDEGMLELERGFRWDATLKDKASFNELPQRGVEFIGGQGGYNGKQRVRKLAADRRTDLSNILYRGKTIEPCEQGSMEGCGNCEWRKRPSEFISVTSLA
jgi:hypothetical protein